MRIHRIGLALAALLSIQFLASGCILSPKFEDRMVELVLTQSISDTLHATGSNNTLGSNPKVMLIPSDDILAAIDDAGIELDSMVSISVQKVDYRIVTPDPAPTRTVNGQILVGVGSTAGTTHPGTPIISSFSGNAGALTGWINAPLAPAGVTLLDNLLSTMLSEFKSHTPLPHYVGYDASGASTPAGTTSFDYEVRLILNIVGKVETKTVRT